MPGRNICLTLLNVLIACFVTVKLIDGKYRPERERGQVKVKLRFLAPSAGIAEIAKR